MSLMRHPIFIAFSVIAAIAITWFWVSEFDVSSDEITLVFQIFNPWYLFPISVLLLLHVALSSWRWILIEHGLSGIRPSFSRSMTAGVYALGLGNFLPAPLVNVACRGISNRLSGTSAMRGALSGGLDQLSDLLAVSLVAIPAIAALIFGDPAIYLLGAPLMILFGAGLLMFIQRTQAIARSSAPPTIAIEVTSKLRARGLMQIYVLSIARVANLHLITLAIHAATDTASVLAVIVSVPIVTLAIAAFMLPGGIGVSEWSFSAVFGVMGIPPEEIVIFVLSNRIVLTGTSVFLLVLAILVGFIRLSRASEEQKKIPRIVSDPDPENLQMQEQGEK